MTQNANEAKKMRSFAEQSVFASSIPSSMHKRQRGHADVFQRNRLLSWAKIVFTLDFAEYIHTITNHYETRILSNQMCYVCTKRLEEKYGILSPKLFGPTVRKNCSSDREKLLKFEAEGRECEIFLRPLEQFIKTVKGQNNFW